MGKIELNSYRAAKEDFKKKISCLGFCSKKFILKIKDITKTCSLRVSVSGVRAEEASCGRVPPENGGDV